MKIFNCIIVLVLLIFLSFSCGTVKETEQESARESAGQVKEWEYKNISVLGENCRVSDFPAATYTPPSEGFFRAFLDGKTVDGLFQQDELNIFEHRLIVETRVDYTLYSEKHTSTYYMLISGLQKSISDGTIVSAGDVLGSIMGGKAGIVVFSETLDPYLVLHTNQPPVFYAGYFWFSPAFLSPSGSAKWLTFDPVDDINTELREVAEHLAEDDPGFAYYDKRIRFISSMSQYPRDMSPGEWKSVSNYESLLYGGNGLISTVSEVNAGGYKYLFCWQDGFREYLQKEYSLGDEIWLYGSVVTYDVWEKIGYVFIRDFSQESPEEMFERRLQSLKGN